MRFFTRVKLLIGYCDENTLSKVLIGKSPDRFDRVYAQICAYLCVDLGEKPQSGLRSSPQS
jgi:hypothetical protein